LGRERFSAAPQPGTPLASTQVDSQTAEHQFTLRIDHAVNGSLLVGGSAGTLRPALSPDGSAAQTEYLVGAHIGIRF
jgi:hypothetical protein